jgi:hypothetical protein
MDGLYASQLTCPRGASLCDEQRTPHPHETVIEAPDVLPRDTRWAKRPAKVIPKRAR